MITQELKRKQPTEKFVDIEKGSPVLTILRILPLSSIVSSPLKAKEAWTLKSQKRPTFHLQLKKSFSIQNFSFNSKSFNSTHPCLLSPCFIIQFMKVWTFCIQGAKRVFFFFAHVEARVTVLTCQWLMGPCKVNTIDLPNGEAWENGVMILLMFDSFSFLFFYLIS